MTDQEGEGKGERDNSTIKTITKHLDEDFFAKWRGYPGRIAASMVGFAYTAAIFRKMPKTQGPRGKVFWAGFAAGTVVNVLICNLLLALIVDDVRKPEYKSAPNPLDSIDWIGDED